MRRLVEERRKRESTVKAKEYEWCSKRERKEKGNGLHITPLFLCFSVCKFPKNSKSPMNNATILFPLFLHILLFPLLPPPPQPFLHHHNHCLLLCLFCDHHRRLSPSCCNRLRRMKCSADERRAMKSWNGREVLLTETVVVATAMVGSRAWIGGLFTRSNRRHERFIDYSLSLLQEQRLQRLQDRLLVPFDETRPDHQEALRSLWRTAFPNVALTGLVSEQWKDMGWQGPNPSTDFRGCGFVSLENLLFFARTYPVSFRRLLFKQKGDRAKWEYPFAVAGINISFMLIQMLDLHTTPKPKCVPGMNFLKLLEEDEKAFDVLYCIAFVMMDAQWLAMHASYMEFNDVLQATRNQLERELSLDDIHRIQDLPAYNLLFQ